MKQAMLLIGWSAVLGGFFWWLSGV